MLKSKDGKKPQLHYSQISCLQRCGEQFRRIYICGDRSAPGIAALIGSSVHKSIGQNLKNKAIKDELLLDEAIKELTKMEFERRWSEEPVLFSEDERLLGIDKVKGEAIDESVALALLHKSEIAPAIDVKAENDVECKFVLECENYPFNISGTIDVLENAGRELRDTKTKRATPPQSEADTSEQLTVYAMADSIIRKIIPEKIHYDCLIKTKKVKVELLETTRAQEDFQVFLRRFEKYCEIIEKGIFLPADPSHWCCSKKFCGFANDGSCEFFKGKKIL